MTAKELGYDAIAITDECSMAGIVRAHTQAKKIGIKLIIGSEFRLLHGYRLVLLARNHAGYTSLCSLISHARCNAEKGTYVISKELFEKTDSEHCIAVLIPPHFNDQNLNHTENTLLWLKSTFRYHWMSFTVLHSSNDEKHINHLYEYSEKYTVPLVACGDVHMHARHRRALQDVVTCIRENCTLQNAGRRLLVNGEKHLRSIEDIASLYPAHVVKESVKVAELCDFNLSELSYQYPKELVPSGIKPINYLRQLTMEGIQCRWPNGVSAEVTAQIEAELSLIEELSYEHYFLTVEDIVRFARKNHILCQGRGSAANSAVCFCLGITEVDPMRMNMLFERFISKERNEPPDIDVDFEHERREEVIQYLYNKYGRHRTALAATVVSYRRRSAIRDVGKVLGLQDEQIDALAKSMAWWDGNDVIPERLNEMGFAEDSPLMKRFAWLLEQIMGFPRHLSQHVGGFVISHQTLSTLVPTENAAMPDRTIIQWDKDDLEELGLLKVDILALGMLTAIRKCFALLQQHRGISWSMATIPAEDKPTYRMIQKADTIGVFQIESRAQMSMLPRLRPRNFYDLVIEIAIVRPGPIQGGMVNPYLKRRQGLEPVTYPNVALKKVLKRTLGVPVFQEQVMELAMIAAGFSAGEADELRRSMAAWRRVGTVERFRERLMKGMNDKGYDDEFAEAVFKQIRGFGEYGFPESHAASFALLVYVSAWLKCHEPAAFCCAIMNSLPMGFYSPSDLVADARRHHVTVLEIDINRSVYDHTLTPDTCSPGTPDKPPSHTPTSDRPELALQLGFRLIRNLSHGAIDRIIEQRQLAGAYQSIADLVGRTHINSRDQQALAASDALKSISGDRHRAHWDLLGVEQLPGLLRNASSKDIPQQLSLINEGEDIVADYQSIGFTLGRHPLALLRDKLAAKHIITTQKWLKTIENGKFAKIAGLVKVRQRPGSAKGVIFMTTEDETGLANVIIWQNVTDRCRKAVISSRLVVITGTTQREGEVVHLVAQHVEDNSWMLGDLTTSSRDFH